MSIQAAPSRAVSSRGLRLLNVASSVDPSRGDISEVIAKTSRALVALGHEVETVTVDDPKSAWVSSLAVPVQLKGPPNGRLEYSWQFHRWLHDNAERFDAILSHGLWTYHSRAARRVARTVKRPYFVFPHGMLDPWFKRRYPAQHLRKCASWLLAEEAVVRDAAAVFFACDEERDLARKSFRPYRSVDRIVTPGTDEPPQNLEQQRHVFALKFPELEGKRLLLFLGRLQEKEGCDLLLRAFLVLLQSQPRETRYGLHLMLAGSCAQPDYLRVLQQFAAKCDEVSPGSVSLPGALSGDLKWGALRTAEVFVLPSHQENFGFGMAEALACATPVLLSHGVNMWREIEESGAGLADADTLAGCSRLLERWLALPQTERNAMATRATACYRQRFEIAQTARHLVDIVREFLPATPDATKSA